MQCTISVNCCVMSFMRIAAFDPLEKELDFIRNYVELMRIRLPEQVKLETNDTSGDSSGALIAPLLFISLIENAFKHGVSYSKPSFIHIFISPDSEGRMVCDITNSCFPKSEQDKSGSGIGLANLHKRLELLAISMYCNVGAKAILTGLFYG